MIIKILSWNIWFGTYLDKVTEFLKNSDADIVGLQEVTQTPDGKKNIATNLAQKLGYSYVYATGMDLRPYGKEFVMGNVILSKYPIIASKTHILSKTDSRIAIQADIDIKGKILHAFSTHFLHTHQQPSIIQEEQAHTLVSVLPKDNTIVMGDFNATPESKTVAIIQKKFQKADGENNTPTWSVYQRTEECCKEIAHVVVRLDYIFVTSDIHVRKSSIEQSDGSDHLPISAEVVIKKAIA